eukprot:44718_1
MSIEESVKSENNDPNKTIIHNKTFRNGNNNNNKSNGHPNKNKNQNININHSADTIPTIPRQRISRAHSARNHPTTINTIATNQVYSDQVRYQRLQQTQRFHNNHSPFTVHNDSVSINTANTAHSTLTTTSTTSCNHNNNNNNNIYIRYQNNPRYANISPSSTYIASPITIPHTATIARHIQPQHVRSGAQSFPPTRSYSNHTNHANAFRPSPLHNRNVYAYQPRYVQTTTRVSHSGHKRQRVSNSNINTMPGLLPPPSKRVRVNPNLQVQQPQTVQIQFAIQPPMQSTTDEMPPLQPSDTPNASSSGQQKIDSNTDINMVDKAKSPLSFPDPSLSISSDNNSKNNNKKKPYSTEDDVSSIASGLNSLSPNIADPVIMGKDKKKNDGNIGINVDVEMDNGGSRPSVSANNGGTDCTDHRGEVVSESDTESEHTILSDHDHNEMDGNKNKNGNRNLNKNVNGYNHNGMISQILAENKEKSRHIWSNSEPPPQRPKECLNIIH